MNGAARRIAVLLFGSGFCGLVYQVVWFREFRLIFGASTAASAAVLAIFIGGLGAGGLVLGRRVDRSARPLELYSMLEAGAAIFAMATPFLLTLIRSLYLHLGGSVVLGSVGGLIARLVLAALVLSVPTILMGGTLPAAARAAESADDRSRGNLALLYGANALGAVLGSMVATFFALEVLGTSQTLWTAALLNIIVAVTARVLARALPATAPDASTERVERAGAAPARFVAVAASVVGLAFFLMEMVWYRMLGPLLGGSVYTFGLIISVALLGIGIGGVLYSVRGHQREATLGGFAMTCLGEGLWVVVPLALGDRLALFEAFLRPLGSTGFGGLILAWTLVGLVIILMPAIIAGYQFPLLIGLLGSGTERVGRDVGMAYAANTVGAMVGSLAGGFGLLPWLGATGCWRLVAVLLVVQGLAALALEALKGKAPARATTAVAVAALALWLAAARGPTALWRHTPIGAGRVSTSILGSIDAIESFARQTRDSVVWESDGVESSVALTASDGLAFAVNGKIDGHALFDSGTQIMGGVLGALLHGSAKRALVVGLGTGSSAGWLGALPGMERVDVVELEPLILKVARDCAPVNEHVLDNPRVHVQIGDAREVLLVNPQTYDVIFSEPSNPYRAGIASLYTREFYEGAATKLAPGGKFVQWIQAYEIDARTLRTIVATISSVFPNIEMYSGAPGDLLMIASREPPHYDRAQLTALLAQPKYAEALQNGWGVGGLDGLMSHYLAGPQIAPLIRDAEQGDVNTDDDNVVEFGLASTVGRSEGPDLLHDLAELAAARGANRPPLEGVDWDAAMDILDGWRAIHGFGAPSAPTSPEQRYRFEARELERKGRHADALKVWKLQSTKPTSPVDAQLMGLAGVMANDPEIEAQLAASPLLPVERALLTGVLRVEQKRTAEACDLFATGFQGYQQQAWASPMFLRAALNAVPPLAQLDPACGKRLLGELQSPFTVRLADSTRKKTRLGLSRQVAFRETCMDVLQEFSPDPWWERPVLKFRAECYAVHDDPRAKEALADLQRFESQQPTRVWQGLEGGALGAGKGAQEPPAPQPPVPQQAAGAQAPAPPGP